MKVFLYQCNPTQDVERNTQIIRQGIIEARSSGADVVVFPEYMTIGYPTGALCKRKVWQQQEDVANLILVGLKNDSYHLTVIYGGIEETRLTNGWYRRFNSAYIIDKTYGIRVIRKRLLSRVDSLYFTRGNTPQQPIPVVVGEDIVNCDVLLHTDICNIDCQGDGHGPATWLVDPVAKLKGSDKVGGPVFVLASEPFWLGQTEEIKTLINNISSRLQRSVCWCNQVGGYDDFVAGGYSMVCQAWNYSVSMVHNVLIPASPDEYITQVDKGFATSSIFFNETDKLFESDDEDCLSQMYAATKFYIKEYCRRNGFSKAILGLSGGVDSTLVAAIATDALGSENVIGVLIPSEYSSGGSVTDAKTLARNLCMPTYQIPINEIHQLFRDTLLDGGKQAFANPVTDEDLQPRIRMVILMALSNDYNAILLSTGNKSESMVGYCTLFGDSCGLAVIGDLWKTEVYELCRFINKKRGNVIPASILNKAPSAELKPGQRDTDTLPAYGILDNILKMIAEGMSVEEIQRKSEYIPRTIVDIYRRYTASGFKRKQNPFGLKLQGISFENHFTYKLC